MIMTQKNALVCIDVHYSRKKQNSKFALVSLNFRATAVVSCASELSTGSCGLNAFQ